MAATVARADDSVRGHWPVARLGKRVLRLGGAGLPHTLLAGADVTDAEVLDRTAAATLTRKPAGAAT
ncbi:hypothetical protein [Mycobacterium simiae]|uniref:hypothetical protein n=1 Tax=Mycobacterium simiae TaxID=1784 RepID=UPI003F4D231A